MNWRPIEDAPRDGTRFCATGKNSGGNSKGRHVAIVHWVGDSDIDEGLFIDDDGDEYSYLDFWTDLEFPE